MILVGNGAWHQYDVRTQNVLSDVIAKYGVVHMTVQICGRAKQVCKSWYGALNACDPCKQLLSFGLICTPMCKRFVAALVEIDTSQTQKSHDFLRDLNQEDYESIMFFRALRHAMHGYANQSLFLSDMLNGSSKFIQNSPSDKDDLLTGADVLFRYFYPQCPVTKCSHIISDMPIVKLENEFTVHTVGELLEQIENIRKDSACVRFMKVIGDHKLLPIEPALLQAYKEPQDESFKELLEVLKVRVLEIGLGFMMFLVILPILWQFGF